MRAHWKKKTVVLALGLTLVVGGGGTAFAYWTTSGSGTGSATTGSTSVVTVNQTSNLNPMGPGVSAQTLSGTFTNPSSGPLYVATVTAAIGSVTDAAGNAIAGCDASDYVLTPASGVMSVASEVARGTGVGSWGGVTIQFNDKTSTNQDACQGATVNLTYTVG